MGFRYVSDNSNCFFAKESLEPLCLWSKETLDINLVCYFKYPRAGGLKPLLLGMDIIFVFFGLKTWKQSFLGGKSFRFDCLIWETFFLQNETIFSQSDFLKRSLKIMMWFFKIRKRLKKFVFQFETKNEKYSFCSITIFF